MPEENLNNIEKILNNPLSGNEKELLNNLKDKTLLDFLLDNFKEVAKSFQDTNKIKNVFDLIPKYIENYDKILSQSCVIDKKLFTLINNTLQAAYKMDESRCQEICRSYFNTYKTKYPIEKLTVNLLLFQKNYDQFLKLITNTPLYKLEEHFESFLFKLIEENQEEQFHFYLFDWILKFGYLIEAYIKEILITQVKFICLLNNEDFNKIPKKELTIGPLTTRFEADNTLRLFRNSIFHTSFLIDYQVNLDDRKLIFNDWEGKPKDYSIEEFIGNYFRLIQVVQIFVISIFSFFFNLHKDKIISEMNKLFKPLKQELENTCSTKLYFTEEELNNIISKLKADLKKEFKLD